jgi:hypothetical protein
MFEIDIGVRDVGHASACQKSEMVMQSRKSLEANVEAERRGA